MVPGARRRQRLVSWAKAVSMQAHIKWEWTNKQSILQGIGDARIGNNGCWNSGTMAWMENRIIQYGVHVMYLYHTHRE